MNIYEFIRYISEENVLFTINKIKLVNLVASEEIRSQVKTKFEMLLELSKSQQITFEFIIDYIGEDLISKIIQDINSQLKALDYDEQKILEDFLFKNEIRPRIFQILDSEMLGIMFAHSIQSEDIRDFLKQIYIIREIKDEEIKKQYKEKCKKFILDIADSKVLNEIVFIMNTYIDDVQAVFSLKELKDIIEKLLEKNIYDKSVEIGASISAGIINILNRIGCDEQCILEIFNKLMNKAKNVVDCKEENLGSYGRLYNLKMNIVFSIFNEEIRKKLLDRVLAL